MMAYVPLTTQPHLDDSPQSHLDDSPQPPSDDSPHPTCFATSGMMAYPALTQPPLDDSPQPLLDDSSQPQVESSTIKSFTPRKKQSVSVKIFLFIWQTLLLPIMGFAYLIFCYVCHSRQVKFNVVQDPMKYLSTVKAVATSITILYVSTSLFPLSSLISDLKTEEFFRVLLSKRDGVSLESINAISTPSYGTRDKLIAVYRRNTSIYFIAALIAALLELATSIIAPAAISLGTALSDGDIVALSVGALNKNTILNMSDFASPILGIPNTVGSDRQSKAGGVAWAELNLGVNYSFQLPTVDHSSFIIPSPTQISTGTRARWISDIVAMKPNCEWIAPAVPSQPVNFSSFDPGVLMNLTSKNLQVSMVTSNFDFNSTVGPKLGPLTSSWSRDSFESIGARVTDQNAMDDLTNGATVFAYFQCAARCSTIWEHEYINVSYSPEMHTSRLTFMDGRAADISFLYCDPKMEIQTWQVSNNGDGNLILGEKVSTSQGNLHPGETPLLLSYALMDLFQAGPSLPTNVSALGNQLQFSMFFGNPSLDSTQLPMKPIDHITKTYAQILQSAAKPFVDGTLGSTYVPARATHQIVVFSVSMPHLVSSTVLYVVLIVFNLACNFRKHAPQYTFFAIARRLAYSDIPVFFGELAKDDKFEPKEEQAVVSSLRARVVLQDGKTFKLLK